MSWYNNEKKKIVVRLFNIVKYIIIYIECVKDCNFIVYSCNTQ